MQKSSTIKIIIGKYKDGYVAYPLGVEGVVVGQGDSYAAALQDVRSAIWFHLNSFGPNSIDRDEAPQEVFIAETEVP